MINGQFDTRRRRLVLTYSGFWTETVAHAMQERFHRLVGEAGSGSPFTLLDDLRELGVQTADIVNLNASLFVVTANMKILRNAMLVSSVLVRRQVSRQFPDSDLNSTFNNYEAADRWLAEKEPSV